MNTVIEVLDTAIEAIVLQQELEALRKRFEALERTVAALNVNPYVEAALSTPSPYITPNTYKVK